jgi:hypothetical protein
MPTLGVTRGARQIHKSLSPFPFFSFLAFFLSRLAAEVRWRVAHGEREPGLSSYF